MATALYSWRARGGTSVWASKAWRIIRWKMTEEGAAKYAAGYGCEIEKLPDSELVIEKPHDVRPSSPMQSVAREPDAEERIHVNPCPRCSELRGEVIRSGSTKFPWRVICNACNHLSPVGRTRSVAATIWNTELRRNYK